MHRVALRQAATRSRLPARHIAGRRFKPTSFRTFSSTPSSSNIFPWTTGPSNNSPSSSNEPEPNDHASLDGPIAGGFPGPQPSSNGHGNGGSRNGSSNRRWRTRKSRDLTPVTIPEWFLKDNVRLKEEDHVWQRTPLEVVNENSRTAEQTLPESQQQPHASQHSASTTTSQQPQESVEREHQSKEGGESQPYQIHESVLREIQACLSAGLSSGSEGLDTFAGGKSHLKLFCPIDGATFFLEKTVEHVADELGADIVRLDAQDLGEIAGDYIKEGPDAVTNSLWSLGFDAQGAIPRPGGGLFSPQPPPGEQEEGDEEGDEYAMDEYDDRDGRPPMRPQSMAGLHAIPLGTFQGGDLSNVFKRVREAIQSSGGQGLPMQMIPGGGGGGGGNMPGIVQVNQMGAGGSAQQWNDLKLTALLEVLVDANVAKRSEPHGSNGAEITPKASEEQPASDIPEVTILPSEAEQNTSENETAHSTMPQTNSSSPKTILLIRGYKELHSTNQGRLILEKLVDIVQKKRKAGQPIVIVGTSASASLTADVSHSALVELQSDGQQSLLRSIVVLPEGNKGAIFRDGPKQIRGVNIRNIHYVMHQLLKGSEAGQELTSFAQELDGMPTEASAGIESSVLSFDEVHRIALTALGLYARNKEEAASSATPAHAVITAIQTLEKSDDARTEWAHSEQQVQRPVTDKSKAKSHTDARLKKLNKQCNSHERRLLKGVVHAENVRTTFNHVHAPAETIESLKNLTMLSLTRPEAFKYGVLATDKITGCLLYGPPGTGKTLLAKAVAKESGATVLEVSGSDVYDMYVGESEKNVRAIFSLAKKLSPCVVFIDEADAIFASRGSGTNRNSHRELINQFLREWDGMTDTNAFIMVATNRPFDLDDAALRRLPRRLLIDLPVEKDREAILGIHLKEETVDSGVSLADLASRTNLYSGSDLKNMCVSAALAAVKEENDSAAKYNSEKQDDDPTFEFPERRTLHMRHFEKALDEITASVSEDMSSLGAIRKFDEKYGDRRGKKKRAGYGFTPGGEADKKDTAKVRG